MGAMEGLRSHPDVLYAGFVQDAQKEYAEASTVFALITAAGLPDPDDLGVDYVPYLSGLGEAVGELRRYILDQLRHDRLAHCEEVLAIMENIYGVLVTMDYPDAMTGGLRRTTDAVRGILEKTRGDLTVALRQAHLETELREFERRLGQR